MSADRWVRVRDAIDRTRDSYYEERGYGSHVTADDAEAMLAALAATEVERDEAVSRAERLEAALAGLVFFAESLHAANAYDSGCDRDGPCPTSQVIRAALAALGSPGEAP